MVAGVACFSPSCRQPVIGQCQGYKGSCGQFYCATHSSNKLCGNCAAQKISDEAETARRKAIAEAEAELRRTFADYCSTAEFAYKYWGNGFFGDIFGAISFFLILALVASGIWAVSTVLSLGMSVCLLPIVCLIFLAISGKLLLVLAADNERKFETILKSITATKPRFDEFFKEWLKYRKQTTSNEQVLVKYNNQLIAFFLELGIIDDKPRQIK